MAIYIGLLSILIAVLTGIFVSTLNIQLESQTVSNVESDGRFILSRLIYDIERSQNITVPSAPGDTNSSLQLNLAGLNYTYGLNAGNLQLTDNNGTEVLNGYDTTVSDLTFKRLGKTGGKNSIKLGFTLTSKTQKTSGPETRNFQTTVTLR